MDPVLTSTIDAVTLYSRGARVTRRARLGAGSGTRVRIGGLPLTLVDSSVAVRVEGRTVATDLSISLDVPTDASDTRTVSEEELRAARLAHATLQAEIEQLERELDRLAGLAVIGRRPVEEGGAWPEPPLQARLDLVDLRDRSAARLTDELRRVRAEHRRALERFIELQDLDLRSSSARTAREHELRKVVLVRFDRPPADGDELFLDYLVPGARWAPSYRVAIDPARGVAHTAMRAMVAQRTGEDWTGVHMTLSTADPASFVVKPELTSIRIGPRRPPQAAVGWRPPPPGTAELFGDYDAAFARDFLGAPVAEAFPEGTDRYEGAGSVAPPGAPQGKAREERAARPTQMMFDEAVSAYGSVPEPMPPPPPAPMSRPPAPMATRLLAKKRVAPPASEGAAFSPGLPSEPEEASSVEDSAFESVSLRAPSDLLDYGELRMPSPRDPERGVLRRRPLAERYLEMLGARDIDVDFDVTRTVSEATHLARELEARPAPIRCTYAWSEDFDYAYIAAAPVDVPSDGDFHSISVCDGEGKAAVEYVCVPRRSTDVFRVATVHNSLAGPLLAGPADVYLGSDFVATAPVSVTAPRGKVVLGLGVEQAIKVARNTRYGEDAAGLLGGSRSLRHEILIEVANLLDRSVQLEVRERVPVITDGEEDVKIEVGNVSPDWSRYEPEARSAAEPKLRGGHAWRIELDRGQKRELRVHYEVRIAAKHELVGGNRREQ